MGCAGCAVGTKDGTPKGCGSKGNCGTGGCNKLNTYDWLAPLEIQDVDGFDVVEVSFKNGARKSFYQNQHHIRTVTGDTVVVESSAGYDVGRISLSGELVRLQMKKKRVPADGIFPKVLRKANERDLEKLDEARSQEKETMVRARAIARTLDLDMKIGDVEFQGDRRKATFYYTADGRVDFRELIRHFAKEFRVKIEMRQIGARQESARIGGIGSCGRELCCSTWLSDFKSVSTAAARYQNLAINQAKLSGQCGRLKCCLNYELDTYMEAIEQFPENADKLITEVGTATLVKTDIFKGLMYYAYEKEGVRGKHHPLNLERVREIRAMNKLNERPPDLVDLQAFMENGPVEIDFENVTDVIELPPEEKKRRRRRGGNRNKRAPHRNRQDSRGNRNSPLQGKDRSDSKTTTGKDKSDKVKAKTSDRSTNKTEKKPARKKPTGKSTNAQNESQSKSNKGDSKNGGRNRRNNSRNKK